jgi:hypothetical protein
MHNFEVQGGCIDAFRFVKTSPVKFSYFFISFIIKNTNTLSQFLFFSAINWSYSSLLKSAIPVKYSKYSFLNIRPTAQPHLLSIKPFLLSFLFF